MRPAYRLAVFAVALSGCVENEYDIELTPVGDSLERVLCVSKTPVALFPTMT